jgi:hypothetical protein
LRSTRQAEIEDEREHPRRVELARRDADQLAKALAAAEELAGDRARHDAHGADLQPGEDLGRPVGSFILMSVCIRLAPIVLNSIRSFSSGSMQARGGADDDGEGGDEGGQRDLGFDAEAEPGHEQRREGDLRHGVDRHQVGHHGALAEGVSPTSTPSEKPIAMASAKP